jgi:hypothetical protein
VNLCCSMVHIDEVFFGGQIANAIRFFVWILSTLEILGARIIWVYT